MNFKPGQRVKYVVDGREVTIESISITGRFVTLRGSDHDTFSCKIGKIRPIK